MTSFDHNSSAPIKIHILYVDDEAAYCRLFQRAMVDEERFVITTAQSGEEALRLMNETTVDIVFTDLLMPRMDGMELLRQVRKNFPDTFVLMLTGVDSTAEAVKAIKAGAYDYILKPLDMDMIRRQLDKIIQHKELLQDSAPTPGTGFRFENLVGKDATMFEIYEKIRQVAQTDTTVLIHGESGAGKELIAEAIHARSTRREQPFIPVNCAALNEALISSALFGHEKGAFTGATSRKCGLFEAASGGTIFLDEIGDIPIQTQVTLLRVLELGNFQRVGGTETIQVDTRIICATNRDLTAAIKEKTFREDLYYRINVVSLTAPPCDRVNPTSPCWQIFFSRSTGVKQGRILTVSPNQPWLYFVSTTGREMSVSWPTPLSMPSFSAKGQKSFLGTFPSRLATLRTKTST
ncbi:sigma-54-dependent transcriptional regulator [Geoalkalibacter subterraneus]|uniref:sigma-54-dependent transcriptional regulator n=1 Tax=Geoalkalibacter subterraneus TaxID=483547 RepID=UPI000AAF027F|nr:sigma-54 dependent transcriptional regulator [Geoalkalibacter subterraneus]